ncbi:phage terminase large subunit [Gemmatimonas sp.]
MASRGLARSMTGRALRHGTTKVVAAPAYVQQPPAASSEEDAPLAPQPGPQTQFLSCPADLCFYGGSAGGGKTMSLVLEATRHHHVPEFTAVYFRRSYTEIFMPKGIWDEAKKVYSRLGWTPRVGDAEWVTPAGGRVVFAHLQHEDTVDNWKSAQIALICFDQLETFTEHQFFYMLSRNRSTCGVRPYIRASFNPEPGWLSTLLQWWWDPATGYAIKERGGVIRWMARISGEIHWGDTRDELVARFGEHCQPLSVTFIPATLDDNKILQRLDPGYRSKLLALPIVEQERLLLGNFKIRPQGGKVLPRAKFTVLTAMPTDIVRWVRGWDNAATKGAGDYTSAVKIGQRANGRFVILHRWRDQLATGDRDEAMRNLARSDGYHVEIALAQEPGSAGKDVVYYAIQSLAGFQVAAYRDTGDKLVRARPFASQLAAGNVDVFQWDPVETDAYLQQMDAFPTKGVADDDVDATTKAFKHLTMMPMGVMDGDEEEFSLV